MENVSPSESASGSGPNHGPLLILGLPFAVEILTLYVLIAVETPLTPFVARLQQSAFGLFALACMGLIVVCVVMIVVLTILERRHRRGALQSGQRAV
jgi:hypothetical protein